MTDETRTLNFGKGTSIRIAGTKFVHGGKALCSDGIVRRLKRFNNTMNGAIQVYDEGKHKGLTGSCVVESADGSRLATTEEIMSGNPDLIVKFIANPRNKNAGLLPAGPCRDETKLKLIPGLKLAGTLTDAA